MEQSSADTNISGTVPSDLDEQPSRRRRLAGLLIGIAMFVALLALPPPDGLAVAPWRVAAVASLLAIFWLTEAVPIAVTALLPVVLFPTLGVQSVSAATAPYGDPIVFLFLGGFVIALAIERWNLHRRIALTVLSYVGAREDRQIAGFMIATGGLSMWVSNTATVALMLPVALAIVPRDERGALDPAKRSFATALMLSVAYGASCGGLMTLIGTPPNALLAGFMRSTYDVDIGFGQWLAIGIPVGLVMGVFTWWLLTRALYSIGRAELPGARAAIGAQLAAMGRATVAEKRVALVFATTALLWIFRPLLAGAVPQLQLSDTTIAIAASLAFFFIPNGMERDRYLLTWQYVERLPWGVLLLFGGGLSLANAVADSGLAAWIGSELSGLQALPVVVLVLAVTVLLVFLTELTSNTATAATFLPVVAALAVSLGQSPLLFAVPAVLGVSLAFMLPVATPPNAIVFGSGFVTIPQMVWAGLWLNLFGIVVIMAAVYSLLGPVFGI